MPILSAHGLTKAYGPQPVLSGATLTLRTGERVGVVGQNGAGKSTLARILMGLEQPDSGELTRRRGASIEYLPQVPSFDGNPTVEDAVKTGLAAWSAALQRHELASTALSRTTGEDPAALLAEQALAAEDVERLGGFDQQHRIETVLEHLGLRDLKARVDDLSGGERRRVALARLLVATPDLAVLDEPTNHLDAETVEWLETYLRDSHRGAVLLITHDRYLLDRVATRTLEVSRGEVFSYDGGYEMYLTQKAERLELEARTEQNRQNFVRRELQWLRRQPKARSTKQKARVERAEAAINTERPRVEAAPRFDLDVARTGKTILEARDLSVTLGDKLLVRDLTLFLTRGERIGIVGPNGIGKTTLLRALLGQLAPSSGRVVIGQNTKIAYFDQMRSGLDDSQTVFENVAGDMSRIEIAGEVVEPRSYLERFGFEPSRQRQPVGSLSGGERARVALARLLRQSANLLVLDEPTNDLDTETLATLEAMLCEMEATALVVTHDRWFLDRVATSILAFEEEGQVTHYPGNYQAYRARRREQEQSRKEQRRAKPRSDPPRPQPQAARVKLSQTEVKELLSLPDAIDRAEASHTELLEKLADPQTYSAGNADVESLNTELRRLRREADRLMARWEELEERKAASAKPG